jgi:hypothetical protein
MPKTIITYTGGGLEPFIHPEAARKVAVKLDVSLALAKGTVLGRKTADNKWKAYADGNADGSQEAKLILCDDVATDASGNHYLGAAAASEHEESYTSVPAFVSGYFKVSDLVGLDAAALADLKARLIFGDNLADAEAVVYIP